MKQLIVLPKQSIASKIFQNNKKLYQPSIYLPKDIILNKIVIRDSSPQIILTYQQIQLNWRIANYNLLNITTVIQNNDENNMDEITENIRIYTPQINYIDCDSDISINIKYNIFYKLNVYDPNCDRQQYYHIHNDAQMNCDEDFVHNDFLKNHYKIENYIKNAIDKLSVKAK
jgi:hypothetical protein